MFLESITPNDYTKYGHVLFKLFLPQFFMIELEKKSANNFFDP